MRDEALAEGLQPDFQLACRGAFQQGDLGPNFVVLLHKPVDGFRSWNRLPHFRKQHFLLHGEVAAQLKLPSVKRLPSQTLRHRWIRAFAQVALDEHAERQPVMMLARKRNQRGVPLHSLRVYQSLEICSGL